MSDSGVERDLDDEFEAAQDGDYEPDDLPEDDDERPIDDDDDDYIDFPDDERPVILDDDLDDD